MLTEDQIQALKAPFPSEALSSDTSRGFGLTSIKAAFVIERLNEVFGSCGIGWCYAHSLFEELHTDNGRVEAVIEVAFQYRFPANNDCAGRDQVVWDAQADRWVFRNGGSNHDWRRLGVGPVASVGPGSVYGEMILSAKIEYPAITFVPGDVD